jgi:hypothetical protein
VKIERVVVENETHEVLLVSGDSYEIAEVPEAERYCWAWADDEGEHGVENAKFARDLLAGVGTTVEWGYHGRFADFRLLVRRPKTAGSLFTPEPTSSATSSTASGPEAPRELKKLDAGKDRMDLLPPTALRAVARVLEFGAKKYAPWAWAKTGGMAWGRLYGAAQRHLGAWWEGEDKDPESGESHLAHAACCVIFLLVYGERGLGKDDRHVYGNQESA